MSGRVVLWGTGDEDRQTLIRQAVAKCRPDVTVVFAADGPGLVQYLQDAEHEPDAEHNPRPDLVFADLVYVAPESVRRIKDDARLRRLPIVAYASSGKEDLVEAAYQSGANAFTDYPETFEALCRLLTSTLEFWFEAAKLPGHVFTARQSSTAPPRRLAAFRYRIDSDHRVGTARLIGPVTGDDLLESVETFLGDARLLKGFKILADYTAVVSVDIDPSEAREVAQALDRYRALLESGQTAAVVSDKLHFLIGELLITAGGLDRKRVRMFTDMTDALAWLGIPGELVRL